MPLASYDTTVRSIYAAATGAGTWNEALEAVAAHVGASGALIAYHDFDTQQGFLLTGGLRDDLNELYLEHYSVNPYSVGITRRPPQVAVIGNSMVDVPAVRRSAFNADVLAPQRIVDQVMVGHAPFIDGHTTGGCAAMLREAEANDSDAVARRLERLSSHVFAALELSRVMDRHLHARQQQSLLDSLPGPALLLDLACRVVGANRAGEAMVRSGDGLALDAAGRLGAAHGDDERPLAAVLAKAASPLDAGEAADRLTLRVRRREGPPLLVVVTPLPRGAVTWDVEERGAAMLVQVSDPLGVAPPSAAGRMAALYGLTAGEARVAMLVGSGLSTPEAAARLQLSANTVRTHLARCFDKTGVRSQAGLARLLALLPG